MPALPPNVPPRHRSEFVKAHDNRHAAIAETQHIEVLLLQGSLIEAEERSLALLELQSNALDAERRLAGQFSDS